MGRKVTRTITYTVLLVVCLQGCVLQPGVEIEQSSDWSWRIDHRAQTLSFIPPDSGNPVATYDLAGCHFCTADDEEDIDQCGTDGVHPFSIDSRPAAPLFLVACHVGAHSRQLEIFAPEQNPVAPLYRVTGAYYAEFQFHRERVEIHYDRYLAEGSMRAVTYSWPN